MCYVYLSTGRFYNYLPIREFFSWKKRGYLPVTSEPVLHIEKNMKQKMGMLGSVMNIHGENQEVRYNKLEEKRKREKVK